MTNDLLGCTVKEVVCAAAVDVTVQAGVEKKILSLFTYSKMFMTSSLLSFVFALCNFALEKCKLITVH